MIRWFIRFNTALCNAVERRLPREFTRSLLEAHERSAAELMNARPGLLVVDVGGGHKSPFARHRQPELQTRLVSVDISEDQLRRNLVADHRVLADVCDPLPLRAGSTDLIVTRSVIEHLEDNSGFFADCGRVLRSGGHCVHVLPCKFAPFAVINQLLPHRLSRAIVHFVFPSWKDDVGFRAYYRNCFYSRIVRMLQRAGFEVTAVELRYYQAIYYKFLFPLYLTLLLYDLALWCLGARQLACQMLVVARRA